MDNYYASCSNDKNICIWSLEENANENIIYRPNLTLRGHESKVITIFELQNNSIVSACWIFEILGKRFMYKISGNWGYSFKSWFLLAF